MNKIQSEIKSNIGIDSKNEPIISVKEARKLLGTKYKSVSDKNIGKIIDELEIFAELSLNHINLTASHVLQ